MPAAVTERPYRPVPTEPTRKRWTRAEFAILESLEPWDQQRLELVDGELINKMGKNRPHVIVLAAIRDWLILVFGGVYINTEAPIDVGPEDNPTTEPQPDLIALAKPCWQIPEANPQPGDLRLVVEISDSTLGFDLTTNPDISSKGDEKSGLRLHCMPAPGSLTTGC